jgi:hypothetical protein
LESQKCDDICDCLSCKDEEDCEGV